MSLGSWCIKVNDSVYGVGYIVHTLVLNVCLLTVGGYASVVILLVVVIVYGVCVHGSVVWYGITCGGNDDNK